MPASNQLINITLAEASDSGSWSDIGGGQGSLQDDGNPIQGLQDRARRVDNSVRGFSFDNITGIDISGAGTHIGQWMNVLQKSKLNPDSIEIIYSSSSQAKGTPFSGHVFPSSSFKKTEDYKRIWVDPNRTPEYSSGVLNLSSIRFFGGEADVQDVGGNAPNFKQDRKDYGTEGVLINGGSLGTPSSFSEAILLDQSNALGVIDENFIDGTIRIGGANCYFSDTSYNFKAGEQPLAAQDWIKVIFDITEVTCEIYPQGIGFFGGVTLEVLGSGGILDLGSQTIEGSPDFDLNPMVIFSGKWTNGGQIIWGGAELNGLNLEFSSPILVDINLETSGLMDGISYFSSGSGHGLVLGANCPSEITLNNNVFNLYATLDGNTGNEAIYNNSGKQITINNVGGSGFSIRNGVGSTTIVNSSVPLELFNMVVGSEYVVERVSNGEVLFTGNADTQSKSSSFNYSIDVPVRIKVRKATTAPKYKRYVQLDTITPLGLKHQVNQILDTLANQV